MVPALSTVLVSLATAVWPLQPTPEVVAPFREPEAVWAAGHRGVDLLGWAGQPVHSATDGTVSFAGRIAGRGVVVIGQGTRRTTYEPVDPTVRAGDAVVAGQVVGSLAWAGSHCAPRPCLHWGLIEGLDDYRDPLSLIACEPRPVRLLPLDREASAQGPTCAPSSVTWGHRLTSTLLRLADALADRPGAAGRS